MTKKPAKRPMRAVAAKRSPAKKPGARTTAPARAKTAPGGKPSKLDRIVAALRAPKGATIPDLMQLTGWQAHSVRGALAGALKKERGLAVVSEKTDGERVYRIEARK